MGGISSTVDDMRISGGEMKHRGGVIFSGRYLVCEISAGGVPGRKQSAMRREIDVTA